MIKVNSKVKLNMPKLKQLSQATVTALEQTAEELHTEVVQAQVIPRKDGALQGEAFFVDKSQSAAGRVSLVHDVPYARRLYYHPEYEFHTGPWEEFVAEKNGKKRTFDTKAEAKDYAGKDGKVHHYTHEGNPNAKGKWFEDWEPGGSKADFAVKAYKRILRRLTRL